MSVIFSDLIKLKHNRQKLLVEILPKMPEFKYYQIKD